jgi:hypothetical protein
LIQIETFTPLRQRRRICRCLIQVVAKAVGRPMDDFVDEVVRRSMRHARLMLKQDSYNWPVARLALRKILVDLEAKAPKHASLRRLRAFIASNDRAWLDKNP